MTPASAHLPKYATSVLGEAVQYASKLQQLVLLFPTLREENEIKEYIEPILSRMHPSTVVRVFGADGMGVDEAEFWETPTLRTAVDLEDRVVITGIETGVY